MEIQLEQLVLFESGEMLFSWVNSEGHICISTEREAKHAIASNPRQKLMSGPQRAIL